MTCAFKWHQAFLPSLLLIMLVPAARAGGPRYVAGSTYFDSSVKGTPLTWAAGNVTYYTDQGDLSSILPGPAADAFVADAFTRWTSIATAALSATRAGQLAEDVSAANVTVTATGITSPTDILPSAISFPVAIVYDADGAVTNALLGQGAGDPNACFNNAVFGGIDNFSTDAHFLHALIVMNGNCAQTPTQLPDLKYRLVRVLGRVLGLDASQTNPNVFTRHPAPTSADYAGLALMHSVDVPNCIPISICYPDADQPQPKMDDRAALSRLYPVTTANQQNFPAKLPLADNTARIHGSVFFVDANAQPAQPMQGVNVVARWIDPTTGLPSPTYVASSISGFLFSGNAGNPATGFNDPAGIHFTQFGADDPSVEGFFDLAGLEIPNGATSAQYELSVEPLDPLWSQSVGPYAPSQVKPSGALQPIVVTVTKGADLQQAQPANRPCQLFSVFPVPASVFQLSPVFGTDQAIAARQSFRPVVVRVTDSSNPANPVIAANVIFQTVVIRSVPDPPPVSVGGIIINRKPSPVILSSSKSSALSSVDGLATLQASTGGFSAPLTIRGTASTGAEALSFELRSFGAATNPSRSRLLNLSDFVKKQSRSVALSRPPNAHSEKRFSATSKFRLHLTK